MEELWETECGKLYAEDKQRVVFHIKTAKMVVHQVIL